MADFAIIGAFMLVFTAGYVFGWAAGRSSGKVEAIEATHGIDLDQGGDER